MIAQVDFLMRIYVGAAFQLDTYAACAKRGLPLTQKLLMRNPPLWWWTAQAMCMTGYTGTPDHYSYVTIKYNASGQEEWVAGYSEPHGIGGAAANALDHSGNVYVTGHMGTFAVGDSDYVTIKYNNLGQQRWVARYSGPGNSDDRASAIAVDTSANVYVTGTSGYPGDYATIKYNSSGQQQWAIRYDGPGNSGDDAVAIAVDSSGNVYVAGCSAGLGTVADYATVKYDTSGATAVGCSIQWAGQWW